MVQKFRFLRYVICERQQQSFAALCLVLISSPTESMSLSLSKWLAMSSDCLQIKVGMS